MRRPGDESEQAPGGRAAERLREHLRDRLGDDSDALPAGVPPVPGQDEEAPAAVKDAPDPEEKPGR